MNVVDPTMADTAIGGAVLQDMWHLAPMLVVAIWSIIQLAADAFAGPGVRLFQRRLALVGVALAGAAALNQFGDWHYDAGVQVFSGFLVVDQFSLLLDLGVLGIVGAVILFAGDYSRAHRFEYGEQETLLLLATFGIMILAHAGDLLAVFLGIETMSIAVYVLVGARWNSPRSPEAALKYFLMGAFASGLLVMGMALLYGATGTTSLHDLSDAVTNVFRQWSAVQGQVEVMLMPPEEAANVAVAMDVAQDEAVTGMAPAALLFPGLLLVIAALMFKVSAVPFHMWTPDAYDGAPTPITAFMAAAVKIGAFAAVLKLLVGGFYVHRLVSAPYGWTSVVAVIALLTMTVGNLSAVRQNNIKRLLAYSSIAHVGYLLIGVVAAASFYGNVGSGTGERAVWAQETGDLAIASILYYVLTYAVATAGAFACVAWFGRDKREALAIHEWGGMAQRHPGMALGMTICLLSLMGMPPVAGFFGKLFVFRAALEHTDTFLRVLVVIALINSVIGAYYYLRIIVAMYFRTPADDAPQVLASRGAGTVVALAAMLSLLAGLGADWTMRRCRLAAAGFIQPIGSMKRGDWVDRVRARWEAQAQEDDAGGLTSDEVPAAAKPPGEGAQAAGSPKPPKAGP